MCAHNLQVQEDITDLTCADLFSEIGKRTPVATRFSTVTHERGSPESLRDVRGFSVGAALSGCGSHAECLQFWTKVAESHSGK